MRTGFSIILPSYRELNINKTIESLLAQPSPPGMKLDKIYVVACGYDELDGFSFVKDKKVKIIEEKKREGKAHAINLALKAIGSGPSSSVVVLQSADTLPDKGMLRNLLEPFKDPRVGLTAGRPVSMDDERQFIGFLNNLIWHLHHFVSLEKTKVGEVLAFRSVIKNIPKRLATDEAYIESTLRKRGYKTVYVPDAVVFNQGPQTVSDFIKQRRRIFSGHVHVKNRYGYEVSTMNTMGVIKALFKYSKTKPIKDSKRLAWLFCALFLESYARLVGRIDFYIFNRVPYVWDIIKTQGR
jgi:biofilm PGA synthesis N-glycosyltransferase PgaC